MNEINSTVSYETNKTLPGFGVLNKAESLL